MRIYSFQTEDQYKNYLKNNIIIADPNKVMFPKSYKWLTSQLNLKIENPNNRLCPMWGWFQYGEKIEPTTKEYDLLEKGTIGYKFTLEIPDNEVVLSDFDLWHFVLNNWPIFEDENKYDEDLELSTKEIEKTWNFIFDLNFGDQSSDEKYIQANFWEIKPEYVISIEKFKAR